MLNFCTSSEGILFTFKKPDLNKLRAACYSSVLQHHAKGHENIQVQFRVCFFRKKYLMVSRILVTATEKESNKAVKLYAGLRPIRAYIVAKWKFDHAQSHDIEWNVVHFECDGESVRMSTSMNEKVLEMAEKDVKTGIVDRGLNGFNKGLSRVGEHIRSFASTNY